MRVSKTLLWAAFLAVGTVGCTTGKPFGISSLHAPGMSLTPNQQANQQAKKRTSANRQTDIAASAHESTDQVAQTRPSDRVDQQPVQTAVHQISHEVSYTPPATPLITLGKNDDFREIVRNAPGAVLVDFYADWCGPCRKQSGILHDMEVSASQNQASIIKVNIDQHKQLAREFNVSSLPTLLVIKNGKTVERQTGLADHQRVAAMLSR